MCKYTLYVFDNAVMFIVWLYSCGQTTLDPSNFGSRRKQPKPIWKPPETANFQHKQQIIPANNWGFMLLNVKTKLPDCNNVVMVYVQIYTI